MNEDITSLMEYKMPTFSKGQKRIANVILERMDKVAFMTANSLGKEAGVSESTVVRFALELGYDGYPMLQRALQEMVLNRLSTSERIDFAADRIGNQDLLSSVLLSEADAICKTLDCINVNNFNQAVKAVVKCKKTYIIGIGASSILAEYMGYYLRYMIADVKILTSGDNLSMAEQLLYIQPEDVVIAFDFSKYEAPVLRAVEYCHNVGSTVIGISNSSLSTLCNVSDYVLVCKSNIISIVDSLTVPLCFINALIASIASERDDNLKSNSKKFEKMWEHFYGYEVEDSKL